MRRISEESGYGKRQYEVILEPQDQELSDKEIICALGGNPVFGGIVDRFSDGRAKVIVYTD